MKPHVKFLRKQFQRLTKDGVIVAADTCEKCLKHKDEFHRKLELHHKIALKDVDPDSGFDPNVQDNISTLCHDCHKGYHACYEDMDFIKWLKTVSLEETYEKLSAYRQEKARIRELNRIKHGRR